MAKAHIDWEKRQITGKSGKIYKISPETITAGRAAEFEIRSILLPYRVNFETIFKLNAKTIDILRGIEIGKIKVGALMEIIQEYENLQKGLYDFQLAKRSTIVEFCGLFCNYEGEDVGNYNEDIIREKYEDWKEIPEVDFFLLCAQAIPYFRDYLRTIKEEIENSPQTGFRSAKLQTK